MTNKELESMAVENVPPPLEAPKVEAQPITDDEPVEPVSQLADGESSADLVAATKANSMLITTTTSKLGDRRKVKADGAVIDGDVVGEDIATERVSISKKIIACQEYTDITTHDDRFRRLIMSRVLHSHYKRGHYRLPMRLMDWFLEQVEEYKATREILVDAFIEVYDQHVEDSRNELGVLFESSNYLSAEKAREAFSFSWTTVAEIRPEDSVDTRLIEINPSEYQRQVAQQRRTVEDACEEIRRTLRAGLLELVNALAEKLEPGEDSKPKILRSARIEAINAWLAIFEDKNITNDVKLAETVAALKNVMAGTDRDVLTSSDAVREGTLNVLDIVSDGLAKDIGVKPRRKMRFGRKAA